MCKPARVFLPALLLFAAHSAHADTELTLRNDLLDRLKDRVTVTESFFVDAASNVHPDGEDGEIHIAVRSNKIGFACVAEIMDMRRLNKASSNGATKMVKKRQTEGTSGLITGVWRFWSEHGKGKFVQNSKLKRFKTSNPNHMFELHPVLAMGGQSFYSTFHPLDGFDLRKKPNRTRSAFKLFEGLQASAVRGPTATKITSDNHDFNFIDFRAELVSAGPEMVIDGAFVEADAYDWSDSGLTSALATNIRLVFTKDSAPYNKMRELFEFGTSARPRMHLVGFARMSLAGIDLRLTNGNGTWQGKLPYEIVVTGAFAD